LRQNALGAADERGQIDGTQGFLQKAAGWQSDIIAILCFALLEPGIPSCFKVASGQAPALRRTGLFFAAGPSQAKALRKNV